MANDQNCQIPLPTQFGGYSGFSSGRIDIQSSSTDFQSALNGVRSPLSAPYQLHVIRCQVLDLRKLAGSAKGTRETLLDRNIFPPASCRRSTTSSRASFNQLLLLSPLVGHSRHQIPEQRVCRRGSSGGGSGRSALWKAIGKTGYSLG